MLKEVILLLPMRRLKKHRAFIPTGTAGKKRGLDWPQAALSRVFVVALLGLGLTACATTNLSDSWVDPSVRPGSHFKKVLAAVLNANPWVRRSAEDALVASIKRSEAVPAYGLIPDSEIGDLERIKARLRTAGIDGVVVMHVTGVDRQLARVGQGAVSFSGHWSAVQPIVYDPGYLRTDTTVLVETKVYSVADEKLLYTAHSKTFNPADAAKAVQDIAQSIGEDLKRRGLLP